MSKTTIRILTVGIQGEAGQHMGRDEVHVVSEKFAAQLIAAGRAREATADDVAAAKARATADATSAEHADPKAASRDPAPTGRR